MNPNYRPDHPPVDSYRLPARLVRNVCGWELERTGLVFARDDDDELSAAERRRWRVRASTYAAESWLEEHDLHGTSFVTRREAVRTVQAVLACSPVKLRVERQMPLTRQSDGSYVTDAGAIRIERVRAGWRMTALRAGTWKDVGRPRTLREAASWAYGLRRR